MSESLPLSSSAPTNTIWYSMAMKLILEGEVLDKIKRLVPVKFPLHVSYNLPVWLPLFPSLNSCINTLPMMTSSGSLKIVLNTTVTLSAFASTYLVKNKHFELQIQIQL